MLPVVDRDKCNGCAECITQCPNDAITMVNNKAVINPSKCRNCRICEEVCPVNAIH
ncbi:MAG: 4Fe-4S dicluster domain-containing protein [Promethearchaeota archaeon]|nr:MAG: 4Fe-4S dicluster domain-containing protein [Candidatus Lokiarchaeota archaeon]